MKKNTFMWIKHNGNMKPYLVNISQLSHYLRTSQAVPPLVWAGQDVFPLVWAGQDVFPLIGASQAMLPISRASQEWNSIKIFRYTIFKTKYLQKISA